MIRIVVADDHPLVLRGIEGLFASDEFAIVGLFEEGLSALSLIEDGACDVAVLDVSMPGISGLDILRIVRQRALPVKIVLLTSNIEDDDLVAAVRNRVDGVVLKETAASLLVTCVRAVSAGEQWIDRAATSRVLQKLTAGPAPEPAKLTEREAEIARHVSRGLRNKDIADRTGITPGTVKMHLHNIYEKVGVSSRTELAIYMREQSA
jgi:DNA-binding NarL/FixJ family response regulator